MNRRWMKIEMLTENKNKIWKLEESALENLNVLDRKKIKSQTLNTSILF